MQNAHRSAGSWRVRGTSVKLFKKLFRQETGAVWVFGRNKWRSSCCGHSVEDMHMSSPGKWRELVIMQYLVSPLRILCKGISSQIFEQRYVWLGKQMLPSPKKNLKYRQASKIFSIRSDHCNKANHNLFTGGRSCLQFVLKNV